MQAPSDERPHLSLLVAFRNTSQHPSPPSPIAVLRIGLEDVFPHREPADENVRAGVCRVLVPLDIRVLTF